MKLVFNERKAAQAAARLLLLRKEHSLDYGRLLKLLYLADRQALIESGYTITGDKMVSMDNGTILSTLYDAVKDATKFPEWSKYIGPGAEPLVVSLQDSEPAHDELSRYELDVLAQINAEYGDLSFLALRKLTHDLAEYRHPQGSSLPIDPAEILRNEHVPTEEIKEIEALAEERLRMAAIFGRAS